ncbi:MAG TPA: HEAT repeat domain-containing protein [Thermoanaerobaculia bacterium]|nr:HEAT repeat domain-containing protein [Thermoanaerobaculia bacterium]
MKRHRPASTALFVLFLASVAAQAQPTPAKLIADFESGDSTRCMNAVNATSEHQEHFQTTAAKIAPALLRIIESGKGCEDSALSGLLNLGPGILPAAPAAKTVPQLVRIMERGIESGHHEHLSSAASALLILGFYQKDAAAAVPLIDRWIRLPAVSHFHREAVQALAVIGDGAAPAVPTLLEILGRPAGAEHDPQTEWLRMEIVRALGSIPAAAARSGPALVTALSGEAPDLASKAADSLGKLGRAALPYVLPLIRSANEDIKERAVRVVVKMGPAATEAVPLIVPLIAADNWNVRYQVQEALTAMGPTPEVITALAAMVVTKDKEEAATEAIKMLGSYGPAASKALPELRKAAATKGQFNWSPLAEAAKEAIAKIETKQ